jgi:hypothetical protein
MATLAEKIIEARARHVTLGEPVLFSKAEALRPLYRCTGVKTIDGINREVFIDFGVHNMGTADEIAVEIDTNTEPKEDQKLKNIVRQFDQTKPADIVAYKIISHNTADDDKIPNVRLKVWVLVTDEIVERVVFVWRVGNDDPIWKYMKAITPGI